MPYIVTRPLRPGDWHGKFTTARQFSQFDSTWAQTESDLLAEVRRLGGMEVVLQLDLIGGEQAFRVNGTLRAQAKTASPAVIVSFKGRNGPMRMQCDHFTRGPRGKLEDWQCNVRAIAGALDALRKVERYGIGRGTEQYVGFGALPAARAMPAAMTIDEAGRLLGVSVDSVPPADTVSALWRHHVKECHPDSGGDPDKFRRLTEARDVLLRWIAA